MNTHVPARIFGCARRLCTPPPKDFKKIKLPEPPLESSCCGTGCANCVWFEYGNQLIEYYMAYFDALQNRIPRVAVVQENEPTEASSEGQKNKERVLRKIEQQVPDPNIRAFVLTELRMQWKA